MKYFISTIIGILSAILLISVFDHLIHYFLPLPSEINWQDNDSMINNMEIIPPQFFIMSLISYGLASFIAGFLCSKLKTENPKIPITLTGIVLTVLAFVYFLSIPHPLWVIIAGSVVFIPMTWLGGKIGNNRYTAFRSEY